jgi:thiosulfate dehydrogenase
MDIFRMPVIKIIRACFIAILAVCPLGLNQPAMADQLNQEQTALKGKEHTFGDAFILALGGKLYDNYFQATDADIAKLQPNPAFPDELAARTIDTWRCVSCHGWDYDGAEKSTTSKAQASQFVSLRQLEGSEPDEIRVRFNKVHNDHPIAKYEGLPLDLIMLFLSIGQVDDNAFVTPETVSEEHMLRGQNIFEGICMNCHDPDGKAGLERRLGEAQSLGWIARNEPKRFLHKVINGVPGQAMVSLRFIDEEVVVDLISYIKTLDTSGK